MNQAGHHVKCRKRVLCLDLYQQVVYKTGTGFWPSAKLGMSAISSGGSHVRVPQLNVLVLGKLALANPCSGL